MSQLVNGHIKAKCTVGGGLPSILIRTVCRTGSGSGGLGIVCSIQLGQSHCGGLRALGTSSGQDTGCRSGRIGGCLIAEAMAFILYERDSVA